MINQDYQPSLRDQKKAGKYQLLCVITLVLVAAAISAYFLQNPDTLESFFEHLLRIIHPQELHH